MPYRILLVEPEPASRVATGKILAEADYWTVSVGTFGEATQLVSLDPPDLLVTAVRLGAFNGLHLVLRSRADFPNMPVVVIGGPNDLVFASEVARYGGRFVVKPLDREAFLRLISELLAGRPPRESLDGRRELRKHAELAATVSHKSVRVIELSYGGLRLEFPEPPGMVDTPIDVDFPTLGFSIKVVPRWTKAVPSQGPWWCGAELAPADSDAAQTWRWIVDSLN